MSAEEPKSNLQASMAAIVISDDSSDSNSNFGATSDSSSAAPKPRNTAVKKGAPPPSIPKQNPQQMNKEQGYGRKWDRNLLEGTRFLDNFNPETSRREKNKQRNLTFTKIKPPTKKAFSMYDEQGKLRTTKQDICDCFDIACPGCHFPCESCSSTKCGVRCRVNRKWTFESIEYDGKNLLPKRNPLSKTMVPN